MQDIIGVSAMFQPGEPNLASCLSAASGVLRRKHNSRSVVQSLLYERDSQVLSELLRAVNELVLLERSR